MDINQLKSFVAVAHQQNLTQASELLHLSQPAVSAQIKAIEKNLDIVLFERNAQGMKLTHSGEAFLPKAEALLQQMHCLDEFAASLSSQYKQQIHLGLIAPLPGKKTAQLINQLQQQTNIIVNCRYGLSGDLINEIRKKELHAGFFLGENPYRSLYSIHLETLNFVVIYPRSWQDNILSDFPKSLANFPWIQMSSTSGNFRHAQKLLREWRITPKNHIICDQPHVLLHLVSAGLGITLVSLHDAENGVAQGLDIGIIRENIPPIDLNFIYPVEFEQHPSISILKQGINSVWQLPVG